MSKGLSFGPETQSTKQGRRRRVLWFVDRAGFNGRLYGLWRNAMKAATLNDVIVQVVNLEKHLHKQLIQPYGNRKAPTWIPEYELEIETAITELIRTHDPHAVVLSAPETLGITGVPVESATLNALRGSVYWRDELPHIVILPMSAWVTMVSEKEIQGANDQVHSYLDREETELYDGDSTGSEDEDDDPVFFRYEPILSPVGRFAITADLGKLNRLLKWGRAAPGLKQPFHLEWR